MGDIFAIFEKLHSKEENSTGKIEYIIIGLGNIGEKYDGTRHNAGFFVMDSLAKKFGFEIKKLKFKSTVGEVTISGKKCLVMKPCTFMNNSGEALVEAMNFYKIPIENVIVCFDDISLEPSKLRIRKKGSHGGHNGIRSIVELTGADTFPRIKIGVGAKPHKDYDLADWVLGKFKKEDLVLMEESAEKAISSIELIVDGKIDTAMNKFNS